MAEIKGAHIFSAGTWNDLTFSEADLDQIVQAFEKLQKAGRVPLKFGHNDEQPVTDGKPALGWVQRVWREGKKLLADFASVPTEVFNAIQKELYKFVSIELLRDVERDGVKYPSVLDAVALLGADPPAVTNLDSLSALTWSRKETGLQFSKRLAFTQGNPSINISGASIPMDKQELQKAMADMLAPLKQETEELRQKFSATEAKATKLEAENAALKKQAEDREKADRDTAIKANKDRFTNLVESAVKAGTITPADRDKLEKELMPDDESALKINFTVVEMMTRGNGRKQDVRRPTSFSRNEDGTNVEHAADEAKGKLEDQVRKLQAAGDKRDVFTLTAHVMRLNPQLAKIVHSEILAGDRAQ